MRSFHKRVSYFTLIFLLIFAITACIISSILYYASSYNEKNKVYTTATISRIEEVVDENTTEVSHLTFVEYSNGKKTYEAKINYYDPTYEVGQKINIYYYRDDNTKAGTEQGENLSKFFFVFSIALLVINIIAIIAKYRGTKKEKERNEQISKENFMTVQAKYVETIINSDVTVFGTHPYTIVCEWRNPADKKKYRFVSEDLWRSPQRKILEKSILTFEVNFDKTNVNNYKMIIPEILK